jgi:uncharacterized protein
MTSRALIREFTLEPGTGKALELRQGEILRIEQIAGGQCVDFNAFNLHDYKEYMHTGRTRNLYGINPSRGQFLWSAPPRERPLLYILEDTARCNDVLFPRCSAYLYENNFGLAVHTNCHEIQAEAQREYGLTPDDVHDSFNIFMRTGVDANGRLFAARQATRSGDHVELLALIDLLVVPNICGDDLSVTNNFALKPVKISLFHASEAERRAVPAWRKLPSQRTPADFKQKTIKADRALRRDPAYVGEFTNTPIRELDIRVRLDEVEYAALQGLKQNDVYGDNDGDSLRDILFSWWRERFLGEMRPASQAVQKESSG